jgi:nucleoid-associated protein YgaU
MDMFEYRIKGGDTLSSIVFKMYGYTPRVGRYDEAVTHIMALNPQVKDPNLI